MIASSARAKTRCTCPLAIAKRPTELLTSGAESVMTTDSTTPPSNVISIAWRLARDSADLFAGEDPKKAR
jgi:hypothetical protein